MSRDLNHPISLSTLVFGDFVLTKDFRQSTIPPKVAISRYKQVHIKTNVKR
jgi:hypothetical protein